MLASNGNLKIFFEVVNYKYTMQLRELIRKCGLNDINVKGSEREVVLSTVFGLILAGTVYYLIFRKRRKVGAPLSVARGIILTFY